jgi:hypothetical protein
MTSASKREDAGGHAQPLDCLSYFWDAFPTVYIQVLFAYGMDEENEVSPWKKAIMDNETKLNEIGPRLELANRLTELLANVKQAELEVIVPESVMEFASSVLQEYFFIVADIARQGGSTSRLVDRDLFDPNNPSAIEWNEGITINDVVPYEGAHLDGEFWGDPEDYYQEFGLEPSFAPRYAGFEPVTNYLSGQYNRFFPLKIVMRVACNLLMNADKFSIMNNEDEGIATNPVHLEELRIEAAKVASFAKERMKFLDSANGTDYGSWFSVALTDGSVKQNERFVAQFVGSTRNPGQGLPFELGFLVNDDGWVKLTQAGLQFALLENPIIDRSADWDRKETLSKNEKISLLNAIKANMPKEYEQVVHVVKQSEGKEITPTEIEVYLMEKRSLTPTQASLERTGLMARIQDLGLILKEKRGRNVFYTRNNNTKMEDNK